MSIDYFNSGNRPTEDRSSWFASITSISPTHNGTLLSSSNGISRIDYKLMTQNDNKISTCLGDFFNHGYKIAAICHNVFQPAGTQDRVQDNIVGQVKVKDIWQRE